MKSSFEIYMLRFFIKWSYAGLVVWPMAAIAVYYDNIKTVTLATAAPVIVAALYGVMLTIIQLFFLKSVTKKLEAKCSNPELPS